MVSFRAKAIRRGVSFPLQVLLLSSHQSISVEVEAGSGEAGGRPCQLPVPPAKKGSLAPWPSGGRYTKYLALKMNRGAEEEVRLKL